MCVLGACVCGFVCVGCVCVVLCVVSGCVVCVVATADRSRDFNAAGEISSKETVLPSWVTREVGLVNSHPMRCQDHNIADNGPRTY